MELASGITEEITQETVDGEDESLIENEEQELAAQSLLVTGGHEAYLKGYSGGLFKPDNVMTRAEVAQMLYNLLAAKPAVTESQFSDVSISSWYGVAVNAMVKKNVFTGYTDGTFLPSKPITRVEFVIALTRCFSLSGGTADFTDVPETHWAYSYVAAATSAGWINGMSNGEFQPNRSIKRCEVVKIMNIALGRTGEGFAADSDTQEFKDVSKNHWAFEHIAEAADPVADGTTDPDPEPTPTPTPTPETGESTEDGKFAVGMTVKITVASGLNLRAEPDTSSSKIMGLSNGTVLTVTDVSSYPWLGVKTASGTTGYIHSGKDDGWYVAEYTPSTGSGTVTGLQLSASSLTVRQYQSARLDASVTSKNLKSLSWSSSNSDVAVVGYTVGYGSGTEQHGAFIYAKSPGTATLTISSADGTAKASCVVTVTSPESVRYAYSSENTALVGESFDLIAVTDTSRSSVTFKIVDGPASGSFETKSYTAESRKSSYGLPTNSVRVFKRAVTFNTAGLYKVRATANNFSDYQEFEVMVRPVGESDTTTSYNERRTSTEGLDIIANFEGAVPEIEDDNIAAGNPTVGYGYVVRQNTCFYNNMTASELRGKLVEAVNSGDYSAAVNSFRKSNNLKMSQAQFDALVSFVYNCGTGALNASKYYVAQVLLNAVAPPSGISESQSYPGVVNVAENYNSSKGYYCNIYTEASLSSKVIATVPEDATVTVIGTSSVEGKNQYWYKVRYGSSTGWVPAGYIQLNTSGLVHDLAYVDANAFSNNLMQWHKSSSTHYPGLLYRRLAECKIFFFGNYAEAYHSNSNYGKNNCGFYAPSCCAKYIN